MKTNQIKVQEIVISISKVDEENFISLTDMAKYKNADKPDDVIRNWIKTQKTIEFLSAWEEVFNQDFKPVRLDGIKNNSDLTTKKWVSLTNAIGIIAKSGRYGGTYAHIDIALEFATWLNPKFKLYVIKEFQRLKENEAKANETDSKFYIQRLISKRNYKIQTQAIKDNLIPKLSEKENKTWVYASEADLLNLALFGKTAKEWRDENPDKPSDTNIRDYASIDELIVLSNLEVLNSKMIENNIPKKERFDALVTTAISQLRIFANLKSIEL